MRLIGLTFITFVFLALIAITIHFWGLGQNKKNFEHPWDQMPKPWRVVSLQLIEKASPKDFIWIDVVESAEKNIFSIQTGEFEASKKSWTELELKNKGITPLKKALEKAAGHNLILNVLSNTENLDLRLSEMIPKELRDKVLIQSPYDVILSSLKKQQPLWLFGISDAERVRMRTFESLWLLPAAPFEGDVYVGTFFKKKVELLSENIVSEIKRRGKKLIVGPLKSKEELELALRLGVDGVLIDQEELLGLTSSL